MMPESSILMHQQIAHPPPTPAIEGMNVRRGEHEQCVLSGARYIYPAGPVHKWRIGPFCHGWNQETHRSHLSEI